jgi:hypothetical protein
VPEVSIVFGNFFLADLLVGAAPTKSCACREVATGRHAWPV